jgi:hypothetical protein
MKRLSLKMVLPALLAACWLLAPENRAHGQVVVTPGVYAASPYTVPVAPVVGRRYGAYYPGYTYSYYPYTVTRPYGYSYYPYTYGYGYRGYYNYPGMYWTGYRAPGYRYYYW